MVPLCKSKIRFATKEAAEAGMRELAFKAGEHVIRAEKLGAYFCQIHGCWHVGHHRYPLRRTTDTGEAIGRLFMLRAGLIDDFGRSQNPRTWAGVRALSGAIRYLTRFP